MNVLSWNLRGINSSFSRLHKLCIDNQIVILIILEPMVDQNTKISWASKLGFSDVFSSLDNKIWIMWRASFVSLSGFHDVSQMLTCTVRYLSLSISLTLVAVYGYHTREARLSLWRNLCDLAEQISGPWLVGGDFNVIKNLSEYKGNGTPNLNGMQDFSTCSDSCELIDIPFTGCSFTWTGVRRNGRVWKRLDRFLANVSFYDFFDDIALRHLGKSTSDHSPLLIKCKATSFNAQKTFKFQHMWLSHESFIPLVKDDWSSSFHGGGMRALFIKLKKLKSAIRTWNSEVFGNIFDNISKAEKYAEEAENAFHKDPSSINRTTWNKRQADLIQKLNFEETFWRQKSRIKWLSEGDASTKFFHNYVKVTRRMHRIAEIKNSHGIWISEQAKIGQEAVNFYSALFDCEPSRNIDRMTDFLPTIVSVEQNSMLEQVPTDSEIKSAVWQLDPNSSPGPDGFDGAFFRACWDIVGWDVCSAIKEFYLGVPIPKALSSARIVLIPKVDNPDSFSKFRPICLATFISKVCTRILANRLSSFLGELISPEQAGFMKGRSIHSHILLANEMVHEIDRTTRGHNLAIKLDMAKAFDRVSWEYIKAVLLKFGFSNQVVELIMSNLAATRLSVMVNGINYGFFQPLRGVKQGDPLSPLLFILASECFTRGLKQLIHQGKILPYKLGRNCPIVSQLSFADDLLIFINGDVKSIRNFRNFLLDYQTASGQLINFEKCSFYCTKKATPATVSKFEQLLGIKRKSLPFIYLGAPIYQGINRAIYCKELLQKVDAKLMGWTKKFLSPGGRLILIKHVLNSIPIHTMGSMLLPKSIMNSLEGKFADFFWNSTSAQPKHHWVRYSEFCLPKEEGGLGLRSLLSLQEAYSLKMWWLYLSKDSLWSAYMHSKYHRQGEMIYKSPDSCSWKRICHASSIGAELIEIENGTVRWKNSHMGNFTLAAAYSEVRQRRGASLSHRMIWDNSIPLKFSILVWKILRNAIPLPSQLQKLGIQTASACPFCQSAEASVNHVFYLCNPIQQIWKVFGSYVLPDISTKGTLSQGLMTWWLSFSQNSFAGRICRLVPVVILFYIWQAYCDITWGDTAIFFPAIKHQIATFILNWGIANSTKKFARPFPQLSDILPDGFGLQNLKPMLVYWKKPATGFLKLNIDASFTPSFSSGGAIIRDEFGSFVAAISFPLEATNALAAEMCALKVSLEWCHSQQLFNLQVETDSMALISALNCSSSTTNKTIEDIRLLINSSSVHHNFREGNKAAHYLALLSRLSRRSICFFSFKSLPQLLKGIVLSDCMGTPYIRFK